MTLHLQSGDLPEFSLDLCLRNTERKWGEINKERKREAQGEISEA